MSKVSVLFIFAAFFFCACDSDTNSAIPTPPGTIKGKVILVDTLKQSAQSPGGVRVRLEGTSFETLTDTNGLWTLSNVPAGTYIMAFEKVGYATDKDFNVQHTGNGTLYRSTQTLQQLPSITPDIVLRSFQDLQITSLDSTWYDSLGYSHYVYRYDTIPKGSAQFTVTASSGLIKYGTVYGLRAQLCFSKKPNIDPKDQTTYDVTAGSSSILSDETGHHVQLYRSEFTKRGYVSGDKVYVIGAVILVDIDNRQDVGYYDYELQKRIVTGFGLHNSEVRSFILP